MAILFSCPAQLSAAEPIASRFELQIATVEGEASQVAFILVGPGGERVSRIVELQTVHTIDHVGFNYENLTETVTLELQLNEDEKADFKASGLVGFNFQVNVELDGVKIILRPRPQGGTWSAAAPCFALMMCWRLTAQASHVVDIVNIEGQTQIEAGTAAAFELCAGFSIISPPTVPPIGLHSLQLRLDLLSVSLTTGWVPLANFLAIPDLPPFQLDILLRWFGDLVDFDWSTIAFPAPQLPQWSMPNLPLLADLPLGIGVSDASVSLARNAGKLLLDAKVSGFYLSWKGVVMPLPGEFRLKFDDQGNYEFFATLYRGQYPDKPADSTPYEFALPFDVLALSADCWHFRAGLFSNGEIDGKHQLCFEVLLEIGGLALSSSLAGDDDDGGLYRTDLRLLMRDFAVLSNNMAGHGLAFFNDVDHPFGPFLAYAGKQVPALSFADDLLTPATDQARAHDYGITMLEGDFRASERLYILWRQQGLRFLRALAHDLLGRPAVGASDAAEPSTLFGLEIAWFAHATQIRLDWRDTTAVPPHLNAPVTAPAVPIPAAPACLTVKDPNAQLLVNLPMSATGVDLAVAPAGLVNFDLPAIRLELARPGAQAIVICQENGGDGNGPSSVSHLMFFPPTAAAVGAVPPLARAMLGFSMAQDDSDGGEQREVFDTAQENCFLTLGLGYAGTAPLALRTIGWQRGAAPRFLQTLDKDAPPFESLIPASFPAAVAGDPGCVGQPAPARPPAAFDFDAFGSPRLAADGWRLSIELAAVKSLFKMFSSDVAGQSVSFCIIQVCESGRDSEVRIETELEFTLGTQFRALGKVDFLFNVRDLSLRVAGDAALAMAGTRVATPAWADAIALPRAAESYWYSNPLDLFGLQMTALAEKPNQAEAPDTLTILMLSVRDGRFMLSMPEGGQFLLRYMGLGNDTLNFWVTNFVIGPGGLDLDAALLASSITVNGLSRPFLLEKAAMRMRSSKLDYLSVDASGKLPELLNEAPVLLTIAFAQTVDGSIDLAEMHCELGDKDTPILSRGTRFKFEITALTIEYARETAGAERQFYFELSGSAQFTPDGDEFAGGLLDDLKSARIEFLRAPLSDDFIKHLSLVVELKRPVTFNVFSLFRMEIRSIGFEPWCNDLREAGPAIIIGGQCEFAKLGDVVSTDISFHAMKIGMPRRGDWMPQVFFDKLRVDISTAEGFRIGGRVDRYDDNNLQGFAGEGTVAIPGFPEISAAFSFVRLRKNEITEWQHAWFVAIAAAKISYQVGPLPIYLRQIGLGFGYRFTLPLIAAFDSPKATMREMIEVLMKAINEHHTLARIDSWTAQPGDARWSIALEAVFTLATANTGPYAYDQKRERGLKTMVLQVLAAYRSDFTIAAGLKMWYPVSVDDFFQDREGMHRRPLVAGFMIYSAPQSRFLAHAASGSDPYMGPKDEPVPEMLKDILRKSHFEATLLIEPGLIHGELGWPDRLMFDLSMGSLKLQCRGGVLFRLERDILIQGTFFSAEGSVNLGGSLDGGFIGVRVEAFVKVQFATRLMTAVYLANPLNSKLYAALGLDIAVRFSISAWLRLKIGFVKIRLNASFSLNLQVVVALELGWAGMGQVGFKGRARITIGVFGRSVGVSIAVGINDSGVDEARKQLSPYMGALLGPGEAPPMPGIDKMALALVADQSPQPAADAVDDHLAAATVKLATAAVAVKDKAANTTALPERFVSALVEGKAQDGQTLWFVWIMPGPNARQFYPATAEKSDADVAIKYATLTLPPLVDETVFIWHGEWKQATTGVNQLYLHPNATFESTTESAEENLSTPLTLQRMLAGCWLPPGIEDEDKRASRFPLYWPGDDLSQKDLSAPERLPEKNVPIKDPRVYDVNDPMGAPNRRLDLSNPFDSALKSAREAIVAPDSEVEKYAEQAIGNQNFLLQTFHDDLIKIAVSTCMDVDAPVTRAVDSAGLLNTGMLICVRSAKRPGWIANRPEEMYSKEMYPKIAFDVSGLDFNGPFEVRPVIDADMIDFALNRPVFQRARAYVDENIIGLAWDLDWAGGKPPKVCPGARDDIEAYLRAYQISFVDLETQRVIHSSKVTPTRLEGAGTEPLDLRYRFTIGRAEVLSGLADQRISHIGATITPISQGGQAGAPFLLKLDFTPVQTPLPPDDAQLVLYSDDHGANWNALIKWRQLALPARPGVALTRGWQLVLRPLRAVPLGAWPEDAADVTDRGLMSASGQALIDGDILIELREASGTGPDRAGFTSCDATRPDNEGRDPAEKLLTLALNGSAIPGAVYDHRGIAQTPQSPKYQAALRFFSNRESAATRNGSSWRLFLRAANQVTSTLADDSLPWRGIGVSGLCQVKLTLRGPYRKNSAPMLRALPHFEWPRRITPGQLAEITAQAGPLQVAVATADGNLQFVSRPGRARAVRIEWNALPSNSGIGTEATIDQETPPLQACAAYDVHELRLDTLVNADCDPDSGFRPEWRWLRRVVASDAAQAAQIPATMADVPNWEAQYPAFACTVAKLESLDVPARDMPDRWPGWYSWDESRLRWPQRLPSDLENGALPGPMENWRLLGRGVARLPLHPYLMLLIGYMTHRGGTGVDAIYELQLVASQPSSLADPIKWMEANTEALDPYGWAALARLGMSVTLTMRDPLTGILAPQRFLRESLEGAVKAVEKASRVNQVMADLVSGWRTHLMTELPIQYLRAYGTGGTVTKLDTAALAMLQLSLRPLPEAIAAYMVFTVDKVTAAARTMDRLTDVRIDLRFPNDDKRQPITIRRADNRAVGEVFLSNQEVMLRDFSSPDFLKSAGTLQTRLEAVGVMLTPKNTGTLPFALLPKADSDQRLSPFGVFGPSAELPALLIAAEPEPEKPLTGIAAYLFDAFMSADDSAQAGVEREALQQSLRFSNADGKAVAAYINWAPRFFRTAPLHPDLVPLAENGQPKFSADSAIAQPKTADPLKIAADGHGRLSLTHFVEEEWAGERTYAVTTVGRYERLHEMVGDNPEGLGETRPKTPRLNGGRADVAFERVRRLAPPTLLLARSLRTTQHRDFHELVMSHAEATLSQQNISVIRKLEFNDIVRSYLRTFLHPEWACQVASLSYSSASPLRVGLPQPMAREGSFDTAPYDIDAEVATLLAAVPQARWNSTRYVDAAEPFYYRQTVRYGATAATDIKSEMKSVVLPSLAPGAVSVLGDDPVSFGRRRLRPEWKDALDAPIAERLASSGHFVTVRLPRLVESLASEARENYFAYEFKRYQFDGASYAPVGYLPDPAVRLLLLDKSANATVTIAQLMPRAAAVAATNTSASELFEFTALSADFTATNPEIAVRTDWADGLYATFDVGSAFAQCEVQEALNDIADVAVPNTLSTLQAEPLLASSELPARGPMAQLAPLAARMTVYNKGVILSLKLTEPLTGPAWLCRPHLSPEQTGEQITQRDLAIGIRMVADTERRSLAALVAFDCTGDDSDPCNRELLHRIEESAFAVFQRQDRIASLPAHTLSHWAAVGITLWRRFADPETSPGNWQQITEPDEQVTRFSCVMCEPQRAMAVEAEQIRKEALKVLRDGFIALGDAFDPARFERLSNAIDRLAGLAWRRAPMRRPAVFIQRGNEERAPWPPQPNGEGKTT
jgi:hypothetical protein